MKIKICGITAVYEIDKLIEVKADYAGFVMFFEKSKRNIDKDRARILLNHLKKSDIKSVAVVVSPSIEEISIIKELGFDIIQVHGEMNEEALRNANLPVFRAYNIDKGFENHLMDAISSDIVKGIVLDGADAGSGVSFDWEKFKGINLSGKEFILAGGLNPENVQNAIKILNPDTIDVSSGVEYDDKELVGKDLEKIELFVRNARSVCDII